MRIRQAGLEDFESVKVLEELVFAAHRRNRPDCFKNLEDSYSRAEFEELLAEVRKRAVDAGAVSMELCVWGFNEKALRFYEKAGMKVQYYRMEEDLRNG